MTISLYKQGLDLLASQIKTLADDVDIALVPEQAIKPRLLDWGDLEHFPGVALCWSEDIEGNDSRSTNERDMRGYPAFVVIKSPKRPQWDERREAIIKLKQQIRQYFNHKRRLSDVSDTSVSPNPCRVTDPGPNPPRVVAARWDVHTLTIWMWLLEPRIA